MMKYVEQHHDGAVDKLEQQICESAVITLAV